MVSVETTILIIGLLVLGMALWWGLLWRHGRKSRAIMPLNTGTDKGAVILLVREEDERIGHVAEVEREVDVNSFFGQASTFEQDAMRVKHGHEVQAASKIGGDVLGAEFIAGLEETLARRRQWIDRCACSLNIHFKLLEEGDSGNTLEKCEEQDESDQEEEETLVTSSHRDSLADLDVAEVSLKATAVEEVEKSSEECIIFIEGDQIEGDQLVRTPRNLDSDDRMVVLSDAKERKSQPPEVEMVESDQAPRSQTLGLPRRQKRDHLDWESAMEVSRLRKRVKYHAYHIDYYDAQLKENSIQAWRSDFSWLVHEPAIMNEDKMRRRRESHIDFFNGYTAELENYYKGAINSETKMVLDFEHVPASLWEWIEPDKQDWRDGDLKGMRHGCNSFSGHASTIKEDATRFKPGHEIQPASKNGGDVLGAEFIAGLEETLARRRQWMDWCARSLDIHFKLLEKEDSAGNTGNALERQEEKPVRSGDSEMIKVADLEVTESSLKVAAVEEAASSRINELDVVIAVGDQAPASAVEEVANHDQAPAPSRQNGQGNLDVVIAVQEEVPLFLSGEEDRDGVEKTSGAFPRAAEHADLLGRLATWFGGRRRKVDRATCGLPSREDGPVQLFYDHKDDSYKQLGEFYGTGKEPRSSLRSSRGGPTTISKLSYYIMTNIIYESVRHATAIDGFCSKTIRTIPSARSRRHDLRFYLVGRPRARSNSPATFDLATKAPTATMATRPETLFAVFITICANPSTTLLPIFQNSRLACTVASAGGCLARAGRQSFHTHPVQFQSFGFLMGLREKWVTLHELMHPKIVPCGHEQQGIHTLLSLFATVYRVGYMALLIAIIAMFKAYKIQAKFDRKFH
ncbi:hypothetical protein SELMODRAFT_415899 [Selaginella moellendorffii]|uniref:Uncharacterized protein n=1 Tax=Selaginella moellendorffii TaxID=88036 RepID=D8RYJ3_SELML|nr:hypothetical protein SELMODRAFT_415899 [Selaginella moellendorffii]